MRKVPSNAAATTANPAASGIGVDHELAPPDPAGPGPRGSERLLRALLDAEGERYDQVDCAGATATPQPAPALRTGPVAEGPLATAEPRRASRARNQPTRLAIVDRFREQDGSMEEVLLELYHAGISLHQVEAITETLWGTRLSLATVSELNHALARRIETWRTRPLRDEFAYVHLGGIELNRNWGGEKVRAVVLVATGVNAEGAREVLGAVGCPGEAGESGADFLRQLRERGLSGVSLVVSDLGSELGAGVAEVWPRARFQSCIWQFYRHVLAAVPFGHLLAVRTMLREIHNARDRRSARAVAGRTVARLQRLALPDVAAVLTQDLESTLTFYDFPREHWRWLRTNYPLQKVLREVRERTRIVGAFTDLDSAVHLVCARLRWRLGAKLPLRKSVGKAAAC